MGDTDMIHGDQTVLVFVWSVLPIVSILLLGRLMLQIYYTQPFAAQDYCIVVAYLLFCAQCSTWIVVEHHIGHGVQVHDGTSSHYTMEPANTKTRPYLYILAVLLSHMVLWAVKLSLLLLYRQMIIGLRRSYRIAWWGMVACWGFVS